MRAVDIPLEREFVLVDDGSTDGTREVLRQLADSTVRVVYHEQNRGQGSRDPHAGSSRSPATSSSSRTPTSSTTPRTGPSCSRRCCAARRRSSTARASPASAATCCSCTGSATGSCRSSRTSSTTRRSPTWRRVTSCSTGACSPASSCAASRFEFEPEVTAKVLRRGHPHLRGADLVRGARVPRGEEDHVARRVRRAVDPREVPLRRLAATCGGTETPRRAGRRWS